MNISSTAPRASVPLSPAGPAATLPPLTEEQRRIIDEMAVPPDSQDIEDLISALDSAGHFKDRSRPEFQSALSAIFQRLVHLEHAYDRPSFWSEADDKVPSTFMDASTLSGCIDALCHEDEDNLICGPVALEILRHHALSFEVTGDGAIPAIDKHLLQQLAEQVVKKFNKDEGAKSYLAIACLQLLPHFDDPQYKARIIDMLVHGLLDMRDPSLYWVLQLFSALPGFSGSALQRTEQLFADLTVSAVSALSQQTNDRRFQLSDDLTFKATVCSLEQLFAHPAISAVQKQRCADELLNVIHGDPRHLTLIVHTYGVGEQYTGEEALRSEKRRATHSQPVIELAIAILAYVPSDISKINLAKELVPLSKRSYDELDRFLNQHEELEQLLKISAAVRSIAPDKLRQDLADALVSSCESDGVRSIDGFCEAIALSHRNSLDLLVQLIRPICGSEQDKQLDRMAVASFQLDPDGQAYKPGTQQRAGTSNPLNPDELVGGDHFTYPDEIASRRAVLQGVDSAFITGRVANEISPPLPRVLALLTETYGPRPVQPSDWPRLLQILEANRP